MNLSALAALVAAVPSAGAQPQELAPQAAQTERLPDVGASPDTFTVEVVFDGTPRAIALFAHPVRSTDYVLRRRLAGGGFEELEPEPPATYRGFVEGWPDARVGASLAVDGLHAFVLGAPGDEAWVVEPALAAGAAVARAQRLAPQELELACPLTDVGADTAAGGEGGAGVASLGAAGGIRIAQIALDVDWSYLSEIGGVSAAQAAVDGLVLRAGLYYEYDFGVSFELTGLVVPASPAADPYHGLLLSCFCGSWNGTGCAGTASRAFLDAWQPGDHLDIPRDVVHLLGGQAIAANARGCAHFRVCNQGLSWSSGYDLTGWYRSIVLIHELGHNWGACHCNQASCAGYDPDDCGFMNSVAGGGDGLFFGAGERASMAAIASSACLHDAPSSQTAPLVTSVRPARMSILGGPALLRGQGFDRAVFVDWAGTLFDAYSIQSAQSIELTAPPGSAFGPHTVTVIGPGGASSATFDYVECALPEIVADTVWIDYLPPFYPGVVTWTYCGPVGYEARLLVSRSAATAIVDGFEVLAHPSTLEAGLLTGVGVQSRSAVFSGGALLGLDFRVQVVAVDAAGRLVGASRILCQFLGSGCGPNPCGPSDDC